GWESMHIRRVEVGRAARGPICPARPVFGSFARRGALPGPRGAFMSGEFEFPINTGNPALDQQTLGQMRQQYAAAGMTMEAAPLPSGGYHVRVRPAGQPGAPAPQQGYGQAPQQVQQPGYGQAP